MTVEFVAQYCRQLHLTATILEGVAYTRPEATVPRGLPGTILSVSLGNRTVEVIWDATGVHVSKVFNEGPIDFVNSNEADLVDQAFLDTHLRRFLFFGPGSRGGALNMTLFHSAVANHSDGVDELIPAYFTNEDGDTEIGFQCRKCGDLTSLREEWTARFREKWGNDPWAFLRHVQNPQQAQLREYEPIHKDMTFAIEVEKEGFYFVKGLEGTGRSVYLTPGVHVRRHGVLARVETKDFFRLHYGGTPTKESLSRFDRVDEDE